MDEQNTVANDNTGATTETEQVTAVTAEQTEQSTEQVEQTEQTASEQTEPADKTEAVDLLADYKPDLPNGVNEEMLAEALPIFKELGLNPDQANKIMPLADKLVQDTVTKVVEDINNQCQNNYEEVFAEIKADKKLGKDFEQNMGQVNSLLTKYGDKETPELFHAALTALSGFDRDAVKPLFSAVLKMARDAADDVTHLSTQKPQETTMYPGLPKGARFK